ncbi:sigma-54-dependent transcriptional regulator [Natronospira bacteriovora]|uniref:Sigma-54 dependent transcriptional regulator n=1 Tax=Natronospira bacteriovora TaxID=3069753 RepID=A0ABU0WA37_9GAMM|nr:sigma-54 dependent transcriptional regulator [Natronospira sp. AB-CW4]MDQ2070901.1 sigma-54 dependent transcriptional regulator [Natronospira sp. AB-CW4]
MSAAHILVVDDESDIREMVRDILEDEGYEVTAAANAEEARRSREQNELDLILLDIWMPDVDGITLLRDWARGGDLDCPVVIMSGHGTVDTAVEATRLGAHEFLEKPLSMAKLLQIVGEALEAGREERERRKARSILSPLVEPVGRSEVMRETRRRIDRVATEGSPVLLLGEAGTGRETLARYLHSKSPRSDGRFINLVLGSLRPDDAEVVLFGRQDGDNLEAGALEKARGGTLFLNELGDMDPEVQRLLMSALEAGGYSPVGSTRREALDVRLVASAQPDIARLVERGRFRQDLLNHLDVLPIHVPPLRDYREDVPDLIRYYVDVLVDQEGLPFKRFSVAAQNRLRNYPWPGNIREVKNMVHRFLAMSDGEEVGLEEVERELRRETEREVEPLVKQDLLGLSLREARERFERAYLEQQLELCGGRVGKLAERVGLERTHLYRKLKALGIEIQKN